MDFEVLGVPIKSPKDLKEYPIYHRVIKLKNGLKALLIRNSKADLWHKLSSLRKKKLIALKNREV